MKDTVKRIKRQVTDWEEIFKTTYLIKESHTDYKKPLKLNNSALAGIAQGIERGPANQRVTSSIPSQGTCLGCRPGLQVRGTQEATTH